MRVLFVHRHVPGQYRHLARTLATDPGNQVVFASRDGRELIPGVLHHRFQPHRKARPDTHPYLRGMEDAVLDGQAMWRLAKRLKDQGFRPDVICAHAGFGPGLYLKEAFPDAPLLGYFEWFYRTAGGDADFLDGPVDPDNACRLRTLNAAILLELSACDWGVCPTEFQRTQFPDLFQGKLTRLHDGVDTDFFRPDPTDGGPVGTLDLSAMPEVLTYATRGMDPYRGFPQFLRTAARLLADRPGLHVVVAGEETVTYGPRRADGRSWKSAVLETLPPGQDLSRLHFTGPLPLDQYRRLLRRSTVHAYLTVPFVLSWSLLEAMACGCAIAASDTPPVREVMGPGQGLLSGFADEDALARNIAMLLDHPDQRRALGEAARARVVGHYAQGDLLPRHVRLVRNLAGSGSGDDTLKLEATAMHFESNNPAK